MTRPASCLILYCGFMTAVAAGGIPYGHADFAPTPQRPVGWLGDGSGLFLGATPPLNVNEYESDKGILWKVPMPFFSQSQPIVVGDRVFTISEPDTMICLEADTGRILWQDTLPWLHLKDKSSYKGEPDEADTYNRGRTVYSHAGSAHHYNWGGSWGAAMSDGQFVVHAFRATIDSKFADLYPHRPRPVVMVWEIDGRRRWAKGGLPRDAACEAWQKALGPGIDWLSVPNFMSWQVLHLRAGKVLQPVTGPANIHVIAHDLRTGKEVWRGPGCRNPHDEGMMPMRLGGRELIVWPDGKVLDANDGKLLGNIFPKGLLPIKGFDYLTPVVHPDHPDVVVLGVMCYQLFQKEQPEAGPQPFAAEKARLDKAEAAPKQAEGSSSWRLRDFNTPPKPGLKNASGVAVMPVRIIMEASGAVRGEPLWKKAGVAVHTPIQASCLGVSRGRVFAMPGEPLDARLKAEFPGWQMPVLCEGLEHPEGRAKHSDGMNVWNMADGSYVGFSLFGNYFHTRKGYTHPERKLATWSDEQLAGWRVNRELAAANYYQGFWHYQRPWTDGRGYLYTQDGSGWHQIFDKHGKRVGTLKVAIPLAAVSNAISFPHGKRLYVRTWPAMYCMSDEPKPPPAGPTLAEQVLAAAGKADDALLMKALRSKYQDDRDAAVKVIGGLPAGRQAALGPQVTRLLAERDWQLRRAAMNALVAIGLEARSVLPRWLAEARKAMADKDWFQAEALCEAAAGVAADGDRDRAAQLAGELRAAAADVKLETRDAMSRLDALAAGLVKTATGGGK